MHRRNPRAPDRSSRRRDDAAISELPALFEFDHVSVAGLGRPRVDDVSGDVPPSGVTVLVGPSGSGKSTLLRLCNRLEVPSSGVVRFRGEDIAGLDPLSLRRRVGMVFQRPTPFAGTVHENLLVAEPTLTDEAATGALERVGIGAELFERDARELSGGEAQRVCLARTLVTQPEVVLMDEATSSVDPAATLALEELGRGLARVGVPVVWVTHDLEQMRRLADQVRVVMAGKVVFAGPIEQLDRDAPDPVRRFLAGEATT